MHKITSTIAVILGLACLAAPASANLIVNGSFEKTALKNNSWAWFQADSVEGWQGSNIELWNNFNRIAAFEGNQLAELNSHKSNSGAFSIFQTFDTQIGSIYDLSFAYRARSSNNEAFSVNLSSDSKDDLWSQLMDDHMVGQWSFFATQFTATDLSTTLRFTSVSSGTVGNFIDDIQINALPKLLSNAANEVSAPAGLLFAGLGCLLMLRLKKGRGLVTQKAR